MKVHFEVTRIIHPIGQGAFYSERITCGDKEYIVVYDCGSGNRESPSKLLKSEISSCFVKDDEIFILFVSHFDNDHINGIKYLLSMEIKIHHIVIPLIEEKDFWFFSQEYSMDIADFKRMYDDLSSSADVVYKVKPVGFDDTRIDNESRKTINFGDNDIEKDKENIINSNTKLGILNQIDWCYIVFNYQEQERKIKLLESLKTKGLEKVLLDGDFNGIIKNQKLIREEYKKLVRNNDGANLSSLIVYSGGYKDNRDYICHTFYNCCIPFSEDCHYYRNCCFRQYGEEEGCLYFGDNGLNQKNLLEDLNEKINAILNHIGLIQVPHHGSLKNFNDKLLEYPNSPMFFVSYGVKNTYGHPSLKIVSKILSKDLILFSVNEYRNTAVVQIIRS